MIDINWVRLQPMRLRIGWVQAILATTAVLCPAWAAQSSQLLLPVSLVVWAGLLGLAIGVKLAGAGGWRQVGRALYAALLAGAAVVLVLAAGRALPPLGLLVQDIAGYGAWLGRAIDRAVPAGALPASRTWAFISVAAPRFWSALASAPHAGEEGARLMLASGSLFSTLAGAAALGWALGTRRPALGWGLPLLGALAGTIILGGGSGAALVIGMGMLLLLALSSGVRQREVSWDQGRFDYSDEIGRDVLGWGAFLIVVVLQVAWLLPTNAGSPLADLLWRNVELPSGVAVIERNIERAQPAPEARQGISTLPVVPLGVSLEEAPPNRVVLRIHTGAPLPPSPQPHYWRARLLNLYDGRSWFSNAQVEPFNPALPVSAEVPGTIRQEISDNRPGGAILVALPDVISVDVPANAERLADGELAALTVPASAPAYQVLSRSQELALPPRPDAPPPDLSDSLGLPAGVPERVRELAAAVAGGVDSPAERALALEAYLRELPYSYEVRPLPRDGDAVDQFLFEMRHGYCTYYASAMAVMARTLGIPARVSIGYATGAYDQASGAYVVSAADAHAWPELYIGGRWTPFEPTPVRALPDRGVAVPTPTAVPAPAESPSVRPGAWLVGAGVGLGVLLMFIGGWFLWRRSSRPLALRVQARLEQRGARSGVAWPPGATLREYGALLALRLDGATDALGEVVDLVERAQYSNHALNDTEEQRLRNAATRLWKHMPRRRSGSAGVTR